MIGKCFRECSLIKEDDEVGVMESSCNLGEISDFAFAAPVNQAKGHEIEKYGRKKSLNRKLR